MSLSPLEGIRARWFRETVAAGVPVHTRAQRTKLATAAKKIPELGYGPRYAQVDIRIQMLRWLEEMRMPFER